MNTPIDISNVVLTTERLTLRPWKITDLDDFFEYASVEGVGEMAGWEAHKSKDISKAVLYDFIQNKKTFALVYENKVIGSIGIEFYDEGKFPEFENFKCREIGYVLSKDYWGIGLMPEAVKEVIKYLFENVCLDIIICGHFVWNKQSARVQEKCGFKFYKNDTYRTLMGTIENNTTNIIKKSDWNKQ